jgi:glycosyltransferase involved in cell wall biosynthesis
VKILFIHGDKRPPEQAGGAETLLRDQAEGLKRLGHETAWWYGVGSLEQAISDFKPDICHLMTLHCYPMGLAPAKYLQANHIPHVWQVQDYWPFCATRMMVIGDKSCSGAEGVCQRECGYHVNPDYLEVCNKSFIVAGNENTAKIYRRNGLRCDAVVELGIDTHLFKPEDKDDPPTIIATMSTLAGEWKGMHILRQALTGTPYTAALLTGMLRKDVARRLSKASIFIFPACYEETCGLSLCEAMASGCACITSDNAGGLAQADNGMTGLIVKRRDVEGLRNAITLLMEDKALREKLGNYASAHVFFNHSLEAMALRWESTYRQAMRESW